MICSTGLFHPIIEMHLRARTIAPYRPRADDAEFPCPNGTPVRLVAPERSLAIKQYRSSTPEIHCQQLFIFIIYLFVWRFNISQQNLRQKRHVLQ